MLILTPSVSQLAGKESNWSPRLIVAHVHSRAKRSHKLNKRYSENSARWSNLSSFSAAPSGGRVKTAKRPPQPPVARPKQKNSINQVRTEFNRQATHKNEQRATKTQQSQRASRFVVALLILFCFLFFFWLIWYMSIFLAVEIGCERERKWMGRDRRPHYGQKGRLSFLNQTIVFSSFKSSVRYVRKWKKTQTK